MDQKQNNQEEISLDEEWGEEDDVIGVKEKFKKLKDKLDVCQKGKADNLAGWQRSQADFINYRRRQEEQLAAIIKIAAVGVIADILPVLDTLESGIKHCQPGEKTDGSLLLIYKQIIEVLKKHGLEEIKALGENFNPELHEAVEQVESSDEEGGVILEVVQKGYLINGKVLRTAKVRVAK